MTTTSFRPDDCEYSTGSRLTEEWLHESEILGYADPWIVSPGDKVDIKISTTCKNYTWKLIRCLQGFQHKRAPPSRHETILEPPPAEATRPGKHQWAASGSYAIIDAWTQLAENAAVAEDTGAVQCSFYVQPWLLAAGHAQTLVSTLDLTANTGFAVMLDVKDELSVVVAITEGTIRTLSTGIQLRRWRWAHVDVNLDATSGSIFVNVNHCTRAAEKAPKPETFSAAVSPSCLRLVGGRQPLTLAAGYFEETAEGVLVLPQRVPGAPSSILNGRLAAPHIKVGKKDSGSDGQVEGQGETWAQYDFSQDISSDRIVDVSGHARHGRLVNAPTRAVKDHQWDGSEPDWTKASLGYGAIHFHEDDLDDAAWDTDFSVTIPSDAVSGAYAVAVQGVDAAVQDDITFFVRPSSSLPSASSSPPQPKPRVALVLSTFTYLAYGNEHMYDETRASVMTMAGGVVIRKDAYWRRMARRTDLGLAVYDVHRDGSGTIFTTARRPLLNIRPGYVNWAFHRPREFSADQFMINFLEQKLGRGQYDVVTEHDIHQHGIAVLKGYDVLLTGSHPEYPSAPLLDAYMAFLRNTSGSVLYLGGNGFYWCSVTDAARPHRMEVRKGDQGCRSIELPAGERNHQLNGTLGGLWRSRGRYPQSLVGIGPDACGQGPGVPYRVCEGGLQPAFSWVWEGLGKEDKELPLIGEFGFGGGASGDEIDRLDYDLGSPHNTVLLATSTGHDESFGIFNEEMMFPMVDTLGPQCDRVRSDMTYYETSGGGAVFAVGSINWYCSLAWDNYDNTAARVTWNVLCEFLRRSAK